jgi:hypothetical protein
MSGLRERLWPPCAGKSGRFNKGVRSAATRYFVLPVVDGKGSHLRLDHTYRIRLRRIANPAAGSEGDPGFLPSRGWQSSCTQCQGGLENWESLDIHADALAELLQATWRCWVKDKRKLPRPGRIWAAQLYGRSVGASRHSYPHLLFSKLISMSLRWEIISDWPYKLALCSVGSGKSYRPPGLAFCGGLLFQVIGTHEVPETGTKYHASEVAEAIRTPGIPPASRRCCVDDRKTQLSVTEIF